MLSAGKKFLAIFPGMKSTENKFFSVYSVYFAKRENFGWVKNSKIDFSLARKIVS